MQSQFASLPVGSKVRVKDFPLPVGQAIPFNFNGLVGTIKSKQKVGLGLDAQPVYQYLVEFKDVEIPYANVNPVTRKIERGVAVADAEQFFEDIFLTKEG